MSDNDQKQYAERGTKGAPSGESAHADRTPPKGVEGELANFQKWKSRREAGEGDTSPKKSDPEGDSDETTAADPENRTRTRLVISRGMKPTRRMAPGKPPMTTIPVTANCRLG